jgi:hypothetical protein
MILHERIQQIRDAAISRGEDPVPQSFQGVTKAKIAAVLKRIDRNSQDLVDCIFALLDDRCDTLFAKAPASAKFCDGATTAHIGCHVGILQRGSGKLDREGRDYWVKPLRAVGAVEPVFLYPKSRQFIPGHPIPKSPNSAYRLAPTFREILTATDGEWEQRLAQWIQEDAVRERLQLQALLAEEARRAVDTKHSDLINSAIEHYAPRFLSDFEVVYVDDGDGDRITEEDRARLAAAGISITLADAMPDVLLWSRLRNALWVIEAVTSDGEVDAHKVAQIKALAERSGITNVGFTTAYPTWKVAAARQGRFKNICPGTHIWIQEDPSKDLRVDPL